MNAESKRRWTEAATARIEDGEAVRAMVVCRRPQPIDVVGVRGGVPGAAGGGEVEAVGGAPRWVLVAATDRQVYVWDTRDFELRAEMARWPHAEAGLRLRRGLLGSTLHAGGEQQFVLPFGSRRDARAVIAAVST